MASNDTIFEVGKQTRIPVSTTHTVTGSIAGVGLSQSFWAVQWPMMHKIFLTWVLTIPATAMISGGLMFIGQ